MEEERDKLNLLIKEGDRKVLRKQVDDTGVEVKNIGLIHEIR